MVMGLGSKLLDGKGEFSFGNRFAVDGALSVSFPNFAARFHKLNMNQQGVAGHNGFAEFDFVGAHEEAEASGVLSTAEHENAGDLSHGFELEDAGHDGMAGEMALEKGFVDGDAFQSDSFIFPLEPEHAIDHEEGVTVGKNAHDLIDIERTFANGNIFDRHELGKVFPKRVVDGAGEFDVEAVAWFGGDDVGLEVTGKEGEIANNIEDFVTNEFVFVAHGFATKEAIAADDDGVFEGASLDEAFVHEGFDFLVKNKGAGTADIFEVGLFGDLQAEKLGVFSGMVGVGAGNFKAVMRKGDEVGSVFAVDVDRFFEFEGDAWGVESFASGFLDQLNEELGAAVSDGGLVGVEGDLAIVDAEAAESREEMFDGLEFGIAFADGGGSFHLAGVEHVGGNGRFVRKIDASKDVA
jgi:hypothetical protein